MGATHGFHSVCVAFSLPCLLTSTTTPTTATILYSDRDVRTAPAVATVTPRLRSSHHVRDSSYRARGTRQARQAVPRVPADRSPGRLLVQEDPGQAPLLRPVVRP